MKSKVKLDDMKTTIIAFTIIVTVLSISITGCKKEIRPDKNASVETNQQPVKNQPNQELHFSENMRVSEYGFLIFPTLNDFDEYREFVVSRTHREIQEYLSSISFKSRGEELYTDEYWDQRVTEEQVVDYMFNQDQVFQVENAIIRPIEEQAAQVRWQFLLVMTPENLSSSSYQSLASGRYDAATMNKFATNPEDESLNILEFIKRKPSGYEETVANSTQEKRPMFGTISSLETICTKQPEYDGMHNCIRRCKEVKHETTYVFWVGFHHPDVITSSWTIPATGCN